MDEFKIGFTGTYINDHQFTHIAEISIETAVAFVKSECPSINMGKGTAEELTIGVDYKTDANQNGWLNKLFIIVKEEHGKYLAVYNHDGIFHLYQRDIDGGS
ncbi:MAG: hypothetical protein ACI86H_002106 [bacterium]|jgi:hypothetical protein